MMQQLAVALALAVVANLAPWLAGRLCGRFAAAPLDLGRSLRDGTRLLGSHKTWRGLLAAGLATGGAAELLNHELALGAVFGALAIVGDAASSFAKRRLRLAPGASVAGLDQLPESLLPLLTLADPLGISGIEALAVAAVFSVLDLAASAFRK